MSHIPALRLLSQPPAPPAPRSRAAERWGNGRIELQLYPGCHIDDRLAAAATLLRGTGFTIVTRENA
jgi:hypothetical protein